MDNQSRHRQRAALGVFLSAVGFVTAHLATADARGPLPLLMALGVFVAGLILVETALFRAIDEAFMQDAAHDGPAWTPAAASA